MTDEDIPTTWDELAQVSQTLTTGDQTGLVYTGEADRVGAFMVQAGGWFTDEEQTEATANTPENEEALTYLQENLTAGNFKHAADVEAGWGGEAFGTGKGAMTVEGPWIVGALEADYPDVPWVAAELPEGPAGKGTLTFSNCWGIAADGDTEGAVELVEHFTSPEEQQAFTEAFGVNPSRVSLEEWNAEAQPEKEAFNVGVDYAKAPPSLPGLRVGEDRLHGSAGRHGEGIDVAGRRARTPAADHRGSDRRPVMHRPRTSDGRRRPPRGRSEAPRLPAPPTRQPWRGRPSSREGMAGWLFVAPVVIVFLVFLVFPILMACGSACSTGTDRPNPLTEFDFVGLDNYRRLLTEDTLLREDFAISVRNTLYYVLVFVPGATALAFFLDARRQQPGLKGRGFFRTVFYFPSITSSVAISITFLFLFQSTGVVNTILGWFGLQGPEVVHRPPRPDPHRSRQPRPRRSAEPARLARRHRRVRALAVAVDRRAVGGDVRAAVPRHLDDVGHVHAVLPGRAAEHPDGRRGGVGRRRGDKWQRFRYITMPLMRPSIALVVTLAIIGSWQVFDQVFIITQGSPQKTTQTPAYLSYTKSFADGEFGQGAAIAFVLFLIIITLAGLQRVIARERKPR